MVKSPIAASGLKASSLSLLTDSAAALTYFMVLSLFPGIALAIALASLIAGDEIANSVISVINEVAPPSFSAALAEPVEGAVAQKGASGIVFVLSAGIALFSASRYVAAFARAADRIHGQPPGRDPFLRSRPLAMLLVGAIIILLPLALLTLVVTGPVAVAVAQEIGISANVRELFGILRWPLLGIVGVAMLSILYLSSEEMRQAGFRRVLPGALVAITCWIIASALFSLFVENLTSFSLIYGSLAGFVVFLIWLYVSNVAVLAGMVVNAFRLGTVGTGPLVGEVRIDRGTRG